MRLAIPNWMVVPTFFKDGMGSEGGTKQGRIIAKSAAQPQTWPPAVKACMRSRFPEGVLLMMDLSQVELRTAALLSGDQGMIAEYQKAKPDLHGDMAVRIFGAEVRNNPHFDTGDGATDPRQWAKQVNFLVLFRGGWRKLQHTIMNECGVLLPDVTCQGIVDSMPKQRAGLWAWQEQLIATAKRLGRLDLPFVGQSRWFMGGEDWEVNEIVNFPVQTTAGNTLLRIQARICELLPPLNHPDPGILMFHNIYDSVWFDCKSREKAAECRQIVEDAVQYVATREYWAWLQEMSGNQVPLGFNVKEY